MIHPQHGLPRFNRLSAPQRHHLLTQQSIQQALGRYGQSSAMAPNVVST